MTTRRTMIHALLSLAALAPTAALAHPFHEAASTSLLQGMLHPLTGLDHVLMIAAVGAWVAVLKPVGRLLVAGCLGLSVAVGSLLPVAPLAGPSLEMAIAATVVGSGMLLAAGRRAPLWATGLVAALFAVIHGFAHGAEGPAHSPLYVPGLVLATSGLAIAASFLAASLARHRIWLRAGGALGAAAGLAALSG